jgi:hypothetical protein
VILRKHTEALLEASREVGLEVNTGKSKYMVVSRHQNVEQNHSILIGHKSFENVAKFKYLGTTETNQSCVHYEIQSRTSSENVCYLCIQRLLFCCLLYKNLRIEI